MYSQFIGVDIGKFEFVVAVYGNKKTTTFTNDIPGINTFTTEYKSQLARSFCVLETTGGYEKLLLETLCMQSIPVHRAHTRKVKHFIISEGVHGKSDQIDALALSRYAAERHERLPLHQVQGNKDHSLKKLVLRRLEITKLLVMEKNRSQGPDTTSSESASIRRTIAFLTSEITFLNDAIKEALEQNQENVEKQKILTSIPGIGKQTAPALIALLPELGRVNRRQIASLVGVAPHPVESGTHKGHRSIKGGRAEIRRFLFTSGMAAARSGTSMKTFYEQLLARGKKKMVALVAVARKILLVANALLKQYYETGVVCLFKK